MLTSGEMQVGLGLLILIIVCYTGGRLHQWARAAMDRDQAYREGYDAATHSLFSLATEVTAKVASVRERPVALTKEMRAPVVEMHAPVVMRPRRGPRHAA